MAGYCEFCPAAGGACVVCGSGPGGPLSPGAASGAAGFVPVPTTGRGNVAGLAAALFALTQRRGEVPGWVAAAARELCRDFGVTMVPDRRPVSA